MKSETLYRALGEIDGALIREADSSRRRMPRAAKIAAASARSARTRVTRFRRLLPVYCE